MKEPYKSQLSNKIDLVITFIVAFTFMLIMGFAFLGLYEHSNGVIMLMIVMVGSFIGYYTSVTFSLLYSIIFVFVYASLQIYKGISSNVDISIETYLWMVIIPLFSILYSYLGKLVKEIQIENLSLRKDYSELVAVDKDTKLKSSQFFFEELQSYMNISRRYNVSVYLMLVKIKYDKQVEGILGEKNYNIAVNSISKVIDELLRVEDRKYILRNINAFGIIFLSNKDGGKFVGDRIRDGVLSADYSQGTSLSKVKLEITVGLAEYDEHTVKTPYDFFNLAEKDMEYDV